MIFRPPPAPLSTFKYDPIFLEVPCEFFFTLQINMVTGSYRSLLCA